MEKTIKEALVEGYKYCGYRDKDEQALKSIDKLNDNDFCDADGKSGPLVVCQLKPYHFSISEESLRVIVMDHICAQDEVADEDCELADLAAEADFKPLVDQLNLLMSKKNFYDLTEIELVP